MPREKSQATTLVEIVEASGAELFHSPEGVEHATIPVGGHFETWALGDRAFKGWISRRYYEERGGAPSNQAVQDALAVLRGSARFEGETRPVWVRRAEHDGALYVDLGDTDWSAVRITPEGWEVVAEVPVRFRRPRGSRPLPMPVRDGSVDYLRRFVNVSGDDDWRLLVGCAVAAFRVCGPYPFLVFHGEQGSAKTTTARVLRELIDPNVVALRSAPREERDLMIAAANSLLLGFDNLSHLPPWLSDAFCRLSTGGGFATRALYTDDEEAIFDAQRPVICTGIDELTERSDLLDRAILLNLPIIPEEERQPETGFWRSFEQLRPRILAGLFDAVSCALANEENVRLERLPRMADFAIWVTAAEPALRWEPNSFLNSYAASRSQAHEVALEASPIGVALLRFMDGSGVFDGSASELLTDLLDETDERETKRRGWPRNARALSAELTRLAPNLRGCGLTFSRTRSGNSRLVHLSRISMNGSGDAGDAHDANPALSLLEVR